MTDHESDDVKIRDFTRRPKKSLFRIDDDVFQIRTTRSLPLLQELVIIAKNFGAITEEKNYAKILDIFDKILLPESAELLRERVMSSDDNRAIDVQEQLMPIMQYVMEEFGVRPTQSSSPSSPGSPSESDGDTLTAGSAFTG